MKEYQMCQHDRNSYQPSSRNNQIFFKYYADKFYDFVLDTDFMFSLDDPEF